MPFSTHVPTPLTARTPREIVARQRLGGRPERAAPTPPTHLAEAGIALGLAEPPPGDGDALRHARAWERHADAGRIGVAPPAPLAGAELRCASLAMILGQGGRA